jgi:hypothetical protein
MLELKVEDNWVPFYALFERGLDGSDGSDGSDDIVNLQLLQDIEEPIYGKYQAGIMGPNLIWVYQYVSKAQLRESAATSKTIF